MRLLYIFLSFCLRLPNCSHPLRRTLDLTFSPETGKTITEGETQVFRAPVCQGEWLDGWVFQVDVYLISVDWDSRAEGDDNWLRIKVSNRVNFEVVICDNTIHPKRSEPPPYCGPFRYFKSKWGIDDIYVQITASSGNPTYLYGFQLKSESGDKALDIDTIPCGVTHAVHGPAGVHDKTETLEQIAIPHNDRIETGETRQYRVPYCFDGTFPVRTITATVLVRGAGGVSTYFCTERMLEGGECYRSVAKTISTSYYDASGSKANTLTVEITREDYGPVYMLVLAQGAWQQQVDYSLVTKLRTPEKDTERFKVYQKILDSIKLQRRDEL